MKQCPKCGYEFSTHKLFYATYGGMSDYIKCPKCKSYLKIATFGKGTIFSIISVILYISFLAFFPISLVMFPIFIVPLSLSQMMCFKLNPFKEAKNKPTIYLIRLVVPSLLILMLFVCSLISWTNINHEPNPEVKEFLANTIPSAPEDNNALYAFLGILAPIGTENTYEWGEKTHKIFNNNLHLDEYSTGTQNILNNLLFFKKINSRYVLGDFLEQKNIDLNRIINKKTSKNNAVLIKRYKDIYKYSNFSGNISDEKKIAFIVSKDILKIKRHILNTIIFKAIDGNPDEALDMWLTDFNSFKKLIGSKSGMLTRTIIELQISLDLRYLNALLLYAPELALTRHDEIKKAIIPLTMKDWNPEALIQGTFTTMIINSNKLTKNIFENDNSLIHVARTQYSLLNTIASRNICFEIIKDWQYLSTLKAPEALKYLKTIENKNKIDNYIKYFFHALYNALTCNGKALTKLIIENSSRGGEIIVNIYNRNAQMKALNLLLDIKAQNIPREKVGEFIKKSSPEYYDPFTEQPMIWDEKKGTILYACEAIYDTPCQEIKVFF